MIMSKKEKIFRTTKEVLKTAKRRKTSSTRWLQRQINDPYVRQAQAEGKRSRAAYKIIQIDEKYKIFNLGGAKQVICRIDLRNAEASLD